MNKKNIPLLILSILIAVFMSEMILNLIKWEPSKKQDGYLQFGYNTGIPLWDEDGILEEGMPVKIRLFQPDKDLFWRPVPNTSFTNSAGFRGKVEFSIEKRKNTKRIVILGDSCSFLGKKLYADFLKESLEKQDKVNEYEIINASVPGYTSYQGRKNLTSLLKYDPDYVCIYFGWNDHWTVPSGFSDKFHSSLESGLKFINLIKLSIHKIKKEKNVRVPIAAYRKNISEIVAVLTERNITPILITAPSGFQKGKMPLWVFDFFKKFYHMNDKEIMKIPETHENYADVLIDISKTKKVIIVDALEVFKNPKDPWHKYFRNDLIHLKEKGHKLLADEILLKIKKYNDTINTNNSNNIL
ncbi:MAG: SGNH/GDSL hydrolase family protein [Proteobacteria bacterium]|nr:SGNH/GDSL hydrolase family protein [Pseudomonadota bacterium]